MSKHAVSGSERRPFLDAKPTGDCDPGERFEVSVMLRCSEESGARQASADDVAAVRGFASEYGLSVALADAQRCTVILSGTVAQFNDAFGVRLQTYAYSGGTYRGRTGSVHVPVELKDAVQAVLGLDNRPVAKPHFRPARPDVAATSYTPVEIASLYGFPAGTGSGQCIALIELGGGYVAADLTAYFSKLGVAAPQVVSVGVSGASNAPTGDPNGPDGEVMLDIEVAGAIANQAKIAVYFAPNTDAGFLNAITTAIHDTTNKPSVISISWGGPESGWTSQAMTAFDNAFQTAVSLGINVACACGDSGSTDGAADGKDHVDFPSSSPNVLACGGTTLSASGGAISSEVVWNELSISEGATGGGVSAVFAVPSWQAGLKATTSSGAKVLAKRGVPDVAGNADPQTGYSVRVDGTDTTIGGTSAVAPLWASLLARLNGSSSGSSGGVGFIVPSLYSGGGSAFGFRDITSGNNGTYDASAGWDACTGLGSPRNPR